MSVRLIATLEVRLPLLGRFIETVSVMRQILAGGGWTLVAGYNLRSGLAGTVINIWEMADFNQVDAGFAALAADPRWPAISASLAECVIRETVQLADPLDYPPPA